jgi:hypothetical protein
MTPRDEFAQTAMLALYPLFALRGATLKMRSGTGESVEEFDHVASSSIEGGEVDYEALAHESYLLADAMLRARENSFKAELDSVLKVQP